MRDLAFRDIDAVVTLVLRAAEFRKMSDRVTLAGQVGFDVTIVVNDLDARAFLKVRSMPIEATVEIATVIVDFARRIPLRTEVPIGAVAFDA